MKQKYKTIGILGGMGPAATAELYNRIISTFQISFNAKYDSDFPPVIIYSLPLPDIVENVKSEKAIVNMLVEAVKKLENAGASLIAVPCNSVFYYFDQMQSAISIPIINIMNETAREIFTKRYQRVGLLGTRLTIKKKLFDKSLKKYGISIINPTANQQKLLTKIIMNVLSGKELRKDTIQLQSTIRYLQNKGAEAVILGCTELPLIMSKKNTTIELFDTIQVITNAVINRVLNKS